MKIQRPIARQDTSAGVHGSFKKAPAIKCDAGFNALTSMLQILLPSFESDCDAAPRQATPHAPIFSPTRGMRLRALRFRNVKNGDSAQWKRRLQPAEVAVMLARPHRPADALRDVG